MEQFESFATRAPNAFLAGDDLDRQARALLNYAIMAPSGHNSQPWLFKIGSKAVDFFADRRRALPVVDPHDRELTISCGAALGTFEVAARKFGLRSVVDVLPDAGNADLLARVRLRQGGVATVADRRLIDAITARRTVRTPFLADPPPANLVDVCHRHASDFGVRLDTFIGKDARQDIAWLVAIADRLQFEDPSFRRELAAWVHCYRAGSRDGMSGAAFNMPDLLAPVTRLVLRNFDLGDRVANDETKITLSAPLLAALSGAEDTPEVWINTGRALVRILLELTAAGYSTGFMNQPVEVTHLRPALTELTGTAGWVQILLRVGRAKALPPKTARRALHEVLI